MKNITGMLRLSTLALATSLCFSSCTVFETPEIREPDEMKCYILGFENTIASLRIESHCHNQNGIGFTFKGGTLDLTLDSFKLGTAVIDTTFKVDAHSDFMVPIQLKVDAVKLGATGMDFSKGVTVKVEGQMRGSAFGIGKTLPIHYEKKHTIDLIMPGMAK